jgi:hypothetical protein
MKVYQTRFGGETAPPEQQGNCAQACIASILEMGLDDVIDISKYGDNDFYDKLCEWLMARGYYMICFPFEDRDGKPLRLPGYYIVGGTQVVSGAKHVEVAFNGEIIHDPISPDFISKIQPTEIWLIYPLNPVKNRTCSIGRKEGSK